MQKMPWVVGIAVGILSFGLGRIHYSLADALGGAVALGVTAGGFTWFMGRVSGFEKERHMKAADKGLTFHNLDDKAVYNLIGVDLTDLVDAYTLEPLNADLNIHQCTMCQVYYHESTVRFLQTNNDGQCISCLSREIRPLNEVRTSKPGRNYDAQVVTLANYRQFAGRVVVFEGRVLGIERDRQARNYVVIFRGMTDSRAPIQMFILEPNVKDVGGVHFIENLLGKTMKVRGLLKHHGGFLYAIFVTNRSMILEIK